MMSWVMRIGSDKRKLKFRTGARVLLLAGDEILLQGDTDPGVAGSRFWQTPGGGVDDGESPALAASRELWEETGLRVEPKQLGQPLARRIVEHGYSDRILVQEEVFFRLEVARFEANPRALSLRERARHIETKWFALASLPALVWPAALSTIVSWQGTEPLDLGRVEESTVPIEAAERLYIQERSLRIG